LLKNKQNHSNKARIIIYLHNISSVTGEFENNIPRHVLYYSFFKQVKAAVVAIPFD
jgi:hypothetical protein